MVWNAISINLLSIADSIKTPSFVSRVNFDNSAIQSGFRPNPIMIKLTSDFLYNVKK